MTSEEEYFTLSLSPPPMDSPPSTLNPTQQDTEGNYSSAFMDCGEPSAYDFIAGEQQNSMFGQNLGHNATPPTLSNALINTPRTTTAQSSPSTDSLVFSEYGTPMYNRNSTLPTEDPHLVQPMATPYVTSAPRAGPRQQPFHFDGFNFVDAASHFDRPTVSLPRMHLASNSPGLSGSGKIRALSATNRLPYRPAPFGEVGARNHFGTANHLGESSTSSHRQNTFTNSPGTPNSAVYTPQSGRRMPNTPLPPHASYVSPYPQPEYPDLDNDMPAQTRSGARQAAVGQDPFDNYIFQFRNYHEAEAHHFWFDDSAFHDGDRPVQNHTLPDPNQYEEIVHELFNSIYEVTEAKDNEGMIKPWGPDGTHRKNVDTLVLVEKACWKLLNRLLDHCGNGPCTAKFQSIGNPTKAAAKNKVLPHFWERLRELNKELKERKSICKRLIAPDYVDQVVDDPTACGKRVQANKQLNKRKADVMAAGKGAMKEKEGHTDGEYDEGDGHDDSGSYGDDGDFETPPATKKAKNRKVSSTGKAIWSAEKPKPKTSGRGAGLSPHLQGESSGRRSTRQGMNSSSSIDFKAPVSDTQKGQAIGVSNDGYGGPVGYPPYNPSFAPHGFYDDSSPQSGNYPQFPGQAHGLNDMNYPGANLHHMQPNTFSGLPGIQHLQGLAPVAELGPFGNQFANNEDMSGDGTGDWEDAGDYHQGDGMKSEFAQQ